MILLLFFLPLFGGCSSVAEKRKDITLPKFIPYGSAENQIVLLTFIEGKIIEKRNCLYLRSRSNGPSKDYLLIWDSTKDVSIQDTSSGLEILSHHGEVEGGATSVRLGDELKISGNAYRLDELSPSIRDRYRLLPYGSWEELGQICDTRHFKTVSKFHHITGE